MFWNGSGLCRGKVHLQGAVQLDKSFYVDEGKLEQKLIDATRVLCSDYGSKQYYVWAVHVLCTAVYYGSTVLWKNSTMCQ